MKILTAPRACTMMAMAASLVVAVALSSPTAQADANAWLYRRPIVVANALESDLRDFQIRVDLNAANFDFDLAQPGGVDLRFTDEDGVRQINHWIERYDPQARAAIVWVKAPFVPASGRRTLYLYYGNPSAEDLSSGGRTFEMFDDFGQPGLGYYLFSPPTTVMTQTEMWETQPPHTLSVIEMNRDGYRYWGYYGLADCGGIGLARSNDLVIWEKLPQPLLNQDGERWPSVQKIGNTIYMIYDRDHCGTSHLVMRTSRDGLTFDPAYKVLVQQELGMRNQNPALFRDPKDGRFYLYWFRGGSEAGFWQIKMRSAETVEGLADPATEKVLIDVPFELAAPNMMAHDGVYFLSTEVNENAWKTKIYSGPSPSGPFTPLPDAPQLSDNQACLFQHVFTTTMHGYICKDTGAGWVLNHRSADLSQGRSAQRRLDPGVWGTLSGEWRPVESKEALQTRMVLSATGQGLLKTALPGSDYVFEVQGRLLDQNSKWGVAVRVQDENHLYRIEVERFVNGGSYVRVYRVVNGEREADLAGLSNMQVDPLVWTTLTVAIHSNEMAIGYDGQRGLKVVDPVSAFTSGNSALWVDGQAQFDNVVWRKFAAAEPAVSVGAREVRSESGADWLARNRTTAPQISPALGETMLLTDPTHPAWTAMAAIFTIIALGIVIGGFVRSRG